MTQLARIAIRQLSQMKPDERTWRPNILAFTGSPRSRWHHEEMAYALPRPKSALTVASILPVEEWSAKKVQSVEASIQDYLQKRHE
jgi:hypothetical protein